MGAMENAQDAPPGIPKNPQPELKASLKDVRV